ncbi:egg cell-secreted protein [Salix suchowensis]|nr:egg cell-secreted protein [Salix suchowensis]
MDYSFKLLLTFFLACSTLPSMPLMAHPQVSTHTSLATRLRLDNEESGCWTDLSPSCCHAIRIIGHHCWPSMLGSLGFTVQEGDILLGYCDATAHSSSPPLDPIFFPNHT